jgi:transcriptional regulator with XRE-family HTH domain
MDLGKLGARIKHLREKRRLRQADVASALRLSAQAVSKWERGENAPDIGLLVALSRLLGVSIGWLLTGSEQEPGTFPATVFATSLTGYALRAVHEPPAELAAWANVIHFAVTEAVLHHDGVPIKCVGDGFLGFFSGPDQGGRALAAAREAKRACGMQELVVVLNTGPIFLGSVGHPEYARTDIIGATVNTAFLLMPHVLACYPAWLGMTQALVDGLPDGTAVEKLAEVELTGDPRRVPLFSLPPERP